MAPFEVVSETMGLHMPRLPGQQRRHLLPYNAAVLGFDGI
jgi:hypothetical protein